MAEHDEGGGGAGIKLSPLAVGLRRAGMPEDEIRALLDPNPGPEARATWLAFFNGLAEAKGMLDGIQAGIPGPTHPGQGRA